MNIPIDLVLFCNLYTGYATDDLLPTNRGFDHFFGFYNGMVHYSTFQYIGNDNAEELGIPHRYDWHEDGNNYEQCILYS